MKGLLHRTNSCLTNFPQVEVVHDDAHGLANETKRHPEYCIANKGIIEYFIELLGDENKWHLAQHSEECVKGNDSKRYGYDHFMEECRQKEHQEAGHHLGDAHASKRII